jgi:UDP-3-O-acyl N-acetylglucosamine deacetylase
MKQKTLKQACSFSGLGLHSGQPAKVTVRPADDNTGISLNGQPATLASLQSQERGTFLSGAAVVEHFLAAAAALQLDNLQVSLEGEEFPALDGSALPYFQAMKTAGIIELTAEKNFISLSSPITVSSETASLTAFPYRGFEVSFMVDFQGIGEQFLVFNPEKQSFSQEIAPARTFGYLEEYEALKAKQLALGASQENALVLSKNGYLNQPRFPDELVRHKILDLIGDLALLGHPLQARIQAVRSGHKLNAELIRRILIR